MTKQAAWTNTFAATMTQAIADTTAPWQKPWEPRANALPANAVTGRRYTGSNTLNLLAVGMAAGYADPRWATFKQIKKAGGHVRKGEKGTTAILFTRTRRVIDRTPDGKPKLDSAGRRSYRTVPLANPFARIFHVFNAEQAEGIPDLPLAPPAWNPHAVADRIAGKLGVEVKHSEGDRAYYHYAKDRVVLPAPDQFATRDEYYATLMHELAHATGHPKRMDRPTIAPARTDDPDNRQRAMEEMRAEICAMMVGHRIGVGHVPRNATAYVKHWSAIVTDSPGELHKACSDAQKMADYMLAPVSDALAAATTTATTA